MVLYLTEGILNESVSGDQVIDAIDKRVGVLITYDGENNNHHGVRYIEPYVYGSTMQNNPAIRAYQYYGDTKKGAPKWKLFRLDRIESWEPTDNTFELEPKARGWAAQAFNGNDKLLPTIFKVVNLGEEPLTDLERLRARTNQLKQNTPLNIKQLQEPKTTQPQQPQQNQSGPIGNPNTTKGPEKPENVGSQPQKSQPIQEPEQQGNKNQVPVNQEPKQNGPIVGDTTKPNENKPEELMSDDKFKEMIRRNLETTRKEKEKRGVNMFGQKLENNVG